MSSIDLARPMVLAEFVPLVGRTFTADCSPRAASLTLVEASPLHHGGQGTRPPFILIFSSMPAAFLVSGSYIMRCGDFGPAGLYISPITPPGNAPPGHYYQAVFN